MPFPFLRHQRAKIVFLSLFWALLSLLLLLWVCCPAWFRQPYSPFAACSSENSEASTDSIALQRQRVDCILRAPRQNQALVAAHTPKGVHAVSPIDGYSETFADLNPQHLTTARQIGIPSCKDRNAATSRADELVYIGDNPYFHVRPLNYSIPYLVPHAATLLEEIGRSFLDSLTLKGYAFQQLVVTSVLRTDADVAQLRTRNRNAAAESAHSYGTTFDISYTHFLPLVAPSQRLRNADPYTLKCILAEVLRDQRQKGTCYVKYEVHQSCFHITAR